MNEYCFVALPRLDEQEAVRAKQLFDNKVGQITMVPQNIYEVFARKNHEEPLMHVGSVNAPNDELAKVHAWTAYDEENWVEMCVVRRHLVLPVLNPVEKPIWGN